MSRKLTHERVSTDGPSKALKTTTFSEAVSQFTLRVSKHTPPTLPAVPGGESPARPHGPEPGGENETRSHRSRRGHHSRPPPPRTPPEPPGVSEGEMDSGLDLRVDTRNRRPSIPLRSKSVTLGTASSCPRWAEETTGTGERSAPPLALAIGTLLARAK